MEESTETQHEGLEDRRGPQAKEAGQHLGAQTAQKWTLPWRLWKGTEACVTMILVQGGPFHASVLQTVRHCVVSSH